MAAPFRTHAALGLLGGAGVAFELALARLVSALYGGVYVYLVLSVALLGLGLGAGLLSRKPAWRGRGGAFCGLACLSATLLVAVSLRVAGVPLALLLPLATVPFVFVGLAVASSFARHPAQSATLYWADLSGAGVGALLALPLLNWGVPGGAFAAALSFGAAGLVQTPGSRTARTALGAACVGVMVSVVAGAAVPGVGAFAGKPIAAALAAGGEIVRTRWDALARTDLVYTARTDSYALYMDGGAGSVVPDLHRPERWRDDIGSFPFLSSPPERTFLLGPGGGLDVALAKAAGVSGLEAAELNAAALTLTRELAPEVGNIYTGVAVRHEEGRRALRSGGPFDLILLSHVITGAAELRAQRLSESLLYTREAFGLYLERLTPTGQLALKLYDEVTLTRALLTALEVLKGRGHSEADALHHVVALLDRRGARPVPLLLVRREALSRAEAVRLGRLAEAQGYALLLLPHLLYPPTLAGVASGERTLQDVISAAGDTDLRPTTDDWPFFFLFGGPPRVLLALLGGLGGLLLAAVLLSPRTFTPGHSTGLVGLRFGVLFAALGAGFMLAQIGALQRGQLVIGHPTQTLSWVLAALLLSSGAGSYLVARLGRPTGQRVALASALVAGLLALWFALLPLAEGTLPLLLSLVPLGFALGIPFATALRPLRPRQVALAWALSGVGSVFGSILALVLATGFGYQAVWLAALGLYLTAAAVATPYGRSATGPRRAPRQAEGALERP